MHRKGSLGLRALELGRPLLLAVAMAGASTVAGYAQTDIAAIAHYSGPDRQTFLEEGARKEGKLTVFSSTGDPDITNMVKAFTEKYPFLDVSVPCCLNSPNDVGTRALAEFKSGRNSIGVVETFVANATALRMSDGLTTFTTPSSEELLPDATDPDGYYVATRVGPRGIGVNTKAVPPEDIPKSWNDLLDPKWKGRIAIAGGEAAVSLLAYLQDTQPKDYIDKLVAQEPRTLSGDGACVGGDADQRRGGDLSDNLGSASGEAD